MVMHGTWTPADRPLTETLIGYPGSDENLERGKELGINAIAMHIGWKTVEPEPGRWDFSAVEQRVREIVGHGLLWAPQLVFAGATPDWFAAQGQSVRQRCVEHGHENGPESIWNPHLRPNLRRFYEAFLKHFGGELLAHAFEIELFTCQYGEPNYFFIDRNGPVVPGWGGALHHGFQCGDELAREDFRAKMRVRYGSITKLNDAWGAEYGDFDEVAFEVPPAEREDPKNDFAQAFDDATNTYRFDDHVEARMAMGRRWVDQIRWYREAMNDYHEFVVRTAREVFGDRRLAARLGGCSYLPWLGSCGQLNVKSTARYGAEVRFTGAVHHYDQKILSTATRFYRAPLWTEPMYAIGRQTGPTMMRGRRWFDAVFFGASCGQDITRSEYTNSFFDHGKLMEDNFPVYRKAVDATVIGQPHVRFAMLLPTTQSCFGFDHRYFQGKLSSLLECVDADVLDEMMIADGALRRYDALLVRMGGLVEPETLAALEAYARDGGVVVFGPKGLLGTLDDDQAARALMGLPAGETLSGGGEGRVTKSKWLKRLADGTVVRADAAVVWPNGEALALCGQSPCMWVRRVGDGAVLTCLCDDDAVLIPAMLDVVEHFGEPVPADGKPSGVLATRMGDEWLLFNRNDQAVAVEVAGRKVQLEPYDENANPLTLVPVGPAGVGIESLEVSPSNGGFEVRLRPDGQAGGAYVELRRPDRRTIYVDLAAQDDQWTGLVPTTLAGEYLLTAYVLDAKGRPSCWRRLRGQVTAP